MIVYSADMTLAGVIYLHEISQTRMPDTARKNLKMFRELCGDAATKNVILATTKWSDINGSVGESREKQLKEKHWADLIQRGYELYRFDNAKESGLEIVNRILEKVKQAGNQTPEILAIQNELVEIERILPETSAGRNLRYTLQELVDIQRRVAAQLRKDEDASDLKEENEKKLESTLRQLDDLGIPLGHRLRRWLQMLRLPKPTAMGSKKLWERTERKPTDRLMPDPRETEIMGPIGVGKSSFVNALLGEDSENKAKVGHELQSETAHLQQYVVPYPGLPDRRVIVVDTPGFDDTTEDDREILGRIAVWLADS
ncbi:hypothetical protein H0H81_009653 [Sphagnurus paluster]|uniref:G domain-containing protein n=1 Tax=Sphagnurus paluster TaxID=117069 RepID=A0A9P7KG75_9AGAR|nr:hypothetical protein H0H81_009653 [Sphagnurus paluster]